ncbi:MAG TPA: AraC family transcriptional regulator [Polyangiaceae bacterium]
MDPLSDLFRVIRLSGGVFLDAVLSEPWCVSSRITEEDCGPNIGEIGAIIGFHFVLEGRMLVQLAGGETREVASDHLVLLPRNDPHVLASEPGLPPVSANHLVRRARDDAMAHIDYGDASRSRTRFVCGYVASATRHHPLLEALPALLIMDVRGKPSADWVKSSFRFAAQEVAAGRPGAQTVLARLSELLFIEAVREHLERLPQSGTGWLAALRDPALARSLSAIHGRVGEPWTADALAAEARLSRSAFAERFGQVLGQPPLTYLTRWRMQIAARRLRDTQHGIAAIAAEVGYESEATFSRAFKREMGIAPGRYRQQG